MIIIISTNVWFYIILFTWILDSFVVQFMKGVWLETGTSAEHLQARVGLREVAVARVPLSAADEADSVHGRVVPVALFGLHLRKQSSVPSSRSD